MVLVGQIKPPPSRSDFLPHLQKLVEFVLMHLKGNKWWNIPGAEVDAKCLFTVYMMVLMKVREV